MASVFSSVLGKLFILLLKDDPFEADLGVGGFFCSIHFESSNRQWQGLDFGEMKMKWYLELWWPVSNTGEGI